MTFFYLAEINVYLACFHNTFHQEQASFVLHKKIQLWCNIKLMDKLQITYAKFY